ncbi:MAG: hypothetical protein Q8R18_05970 [bacterium]|nr:hypothetical protein [bacterium]
MVIFHKEKTIERELTSEELEKERLRSIQNSDVWKHHAALHKQADLGEAQLHISGEPLFGERDILRGRFGLPQQRTETTTETKNVETVSYGIQHNNPAHTTYTAPGSQADLWASCNCGAEFKAENKSGKLEVKSYGVVGSDQKATAYAMNSSGTSYNNPSSNSGYTTKQNTNY